jgi:Zn-dependent membrane protease YugP
MGHGTDKEKPLNLVLVTFIVAVFLFASPFYLLWMAPGTPWYVPYLIWLGVIVMTGVVQYRRGRHEL